MITLQAPVTTSTQFHGNGDKLPVHKQSTKQQSASFDKNSINILVIKYDKYYMAKSEQMGQTVLLK